jgi:carbonic anhydrase
MNTQNKQSQDAIKPQDALQMLKEGNARFCQNLRADRDLLQQVSATADGQWPFAAIVSCIDSRASVELIFDQGIGDVFSARIAGNFVNDDILGSLEFACAVAGAKLVVVLGHSACGAIKGACDHVELGNLTQMLAKIAPAVDAVAPDYDAEARNSSNGEFVERVAHENVAQTVAAIAERSAVLRDMKENGDIDIVGGMYDISNGRVTFL